MHLKSLALSSLEKLRSCTLEFTEDDSQALLAHILLELTGALEDLTLVCQGAPSAKLEEVLGRKWLGRVTVLSHKGELQSPRHCC